TRSKRDWSSDVCSSDLTNLGTAFGMGLIVTTFMLGISLPGENVGMAALIGNVGAIIGSIISVRIMMLFTKKEFGVTEYCMPEARSEERRGGKERRDGGC